MDIRIVCDTIVSLEGSVRPAICLAKDLVDRGHEVTVVSPVITPKAENEMREMSIRTVNLNVRHLTSEANSSVLWFEVWLYENLFNANTKHIKDEKPAAINFSHIVFTPSIFWYLQGPPSIALRDISRQFPPSLRAIYGLLKPIIEHLDGRSIKRLREISPFIVANSKFCAHMYSQFGLRADCVIYPPLDREVFTPSTKNPSGDYVLTYFGKETEFEVIKTIADKGVFVKAFGSKVSFAPRKVLSHRNIEFLGRVSTSNLVDLYSNALYTIFPFTHEPFGYIPLESMACGTPVLTYNKQGPSEYVIDGVTGWLTNTRCDLAIKALDLWRNGYDASIRHMCVKEAAKFDKTVYIDRWLSLLKGFNLI